MNRFMPKSTVLTATIDTLGSLVAYLHYYQSLTRSLQENPIVAKLLETTLPPVIFTYSNDLVKPDRMTVADFIKSCEEGNFIDGDGFGYLTNMANCESLLMVIPSHVCSGQIQQVSTPDDRTVSIPQDFLTNNGLIYVDWYNK